VRQLIHQNQRRTPRKGGVQIKLMHHAPAMGDAPYGLQRQARHQRGGLFAPVRLHHARQHIQPLRPQPLRLLQHGIGFTHSGAGPEKDLQFAPVCRCSMLQQAIRVRAQRLITHALFILQRIQRQIKFNHIHHRLTEKVNQRCFGVSINQIIDRLHRQPARLCHARDLPAGRLR